MVATVQKQNKKNRHNDSNKNNFHINVCLTFLHFFSYLGTTTTEKKAKYYKKGKHVCLNGIIKMIRLIHFICWQKARQRRKKTSMALEWQKGNYFGCGRLLAFFLLFVPFFICLFFSKYILLLRVTTHFMFVNHSDHVPQSSSTMPSTEYTKALKREKLCIFSIFFLKLECFTFIIH